MKLFAGKPALNQPTTLRRTQAGLGHGYIALDVAFPIRYNSTWLLQLGNAPNPR
jgi:hypothetical protein